MQRLFKFQKTFIARAMAPDVDTAALSIPRGNGKSWLAARILKRELLKRIPHVEYLLCAKSIEQSRHVYRFIKADLEQQQLKRGRWRFIDSTTRIGITYEDERGIAMTKLRVLSSNAKSAMGIVGCPLIVADEPGTWDAIGGELMYDAIQTAMGKPGSPLRAIYIGTLWPDKSSGWWPDFIYRGSHGSTYVQVLKGHRKRWDEMSEVKRVNPVKWRYTRKKLLAELAEATRFDRKKAVFCSAYMNLPTRADADVLLSVEDWERMILRDVQPRGTGDPVVGVDIGGRRSWCAATAIWTDTLRVESFAIIGGEFPIEQCEKNDLVARGTYQRLIDNGSLLVAEGKRNVPVGMLVDELFRRWDGVRAIVADRFKFDQLEEDVDWRSPVEARRMRWSEYTSDIGNLDRLAIDGGMTIDPDCRALLAHSVEQAVVEEDDSNNVRLVKRNTRTQRDDVAVSWVLAAGAVERYPPLTPIQCY